MNSYNQIYNEDKLPELKLIRIMNAVENCLVMKHGLKKIPMDVFYCNCDKDHKYTICEACMKACHTNHTQTDFLKSDPTHPATCMCGVKSHQILEESGDKHENDIKCLFHELSLLSQNYEYYENSKHTIICTFCKIFCVEGSKDCAEYRSTTFEKKTLEKLLFEKKIKNYEIKCMCPEIEGSQII